MLKKVEKKSLKKSGNIPSYKNFPKSEKVYVKGKLFKDIKIGMRKISLEDKEFKSFTVYDTSGFYSDPNYKHNYDKGLPKIRENWINRRNDTLECKKTEFWLTTRLGVK